MNASRESGVRAAGRARTPLLLLGVLLLCACAGGDTEKAAAVESKGGSALSWPAVAGASTYGVFVFEPPATAPVWVWVGDSTAVRYGDIGLPDAALPDIPPAKSTPTEGQRSRRPPLSAQAEYGVVAFNSAGGVAAVHQRRRVQ